MKSQIVDYIQRNRVSTTEIADALGKKGAISNVYPLNNRKFCVGNVFWVYANLESNWDVHEQFQNISDGDIVLIEPFDCGERAIFGDIVAKYGILYKGAKALVVKGKLRDAHRLIKEDWPIWLQGVSPVGCFNTKPNKDIDEAIKRQRREEFDGAIAVCDDSGVVIISKEYHTKDFLDKLEFIEEQEDIWYDCIDRKKWSTFDTICLKKYLEK